MKVDLCLWAKNGGRTLFYVLNRINQVIPEDVVNQRLVINDHSTDSTATQIKLAGWTQIINEGYGISDAANTALNHVKTEWFCSFEQDVLLSLYWWNRISRLTKTKDVVAASGVRFLPKNHLCHNIEVYNMIHQKGYGKTLDNTIWNTKTLISIGGFPKLKYAGLDTYMAEKIKDYGYRWLVDNDVQSS